MATHARSTAAARPHDGEASIIDRRAAFSTLAAAAGALLAVPRGAKAEIEPASPDPAFAAIERHRRAAEAFSSFLLPFDEMDSPESDVEAEYSRLDDAERRAMFDLAGIAPTTREGARAALAYLTREACERHYRVLGIFAGRLIEAKWPAQKAWEA